MKKITSIIILVVMCLSLPCISSAIVVKGRPVHCFEWEQYGHLDAGNDRVATNSWYSNCFTPSDNPNIFAFSMNQILTPIGVSKNFAPAGTYRVTDMFLYNRSTDSFQMYARHFYDRNEKHIESVSFLKNYDIDPNGWSKVSPSGTIRHIINTLSNRRACGGCN